MMETKFYKKAMVTGVAFAYFYSYMALDPYDYQAPFAEERRVAQVEQWRGTFGEKLVLTTENTPNYQNVVIWAFNDKVGGESELTPWQLLYALPGGWGISCCKQEYLVENFEDLQCGYMACPAGGQLEAMCGEAGCMELGRDEDMVFYKLRE